MGYHRKSRRPRKRLKRTEKIILTLIVPLAIVLSISVQIVLRGIPNWIYKIIINLRIERSIGASQTKGSAVRVETKLRQDYEKSYREKNPGYNDNYQDILQNRRDKELENYEKYFKKETEGSASF